ncbi:MAG TPA: O-antigen ligase family protein [Blastocatellia bacterium]|nr:O-antigen ligase family protein [Blastocatellia bacterium]
MSSADQRIPLLTTTRPVARGESVREGAKESGGEHTLAFAGLVMFTLLLYLRPNEMFPGLFGTFPIIKIVAILALVTYAASRLAEGQKLTFWPLELKMLGAIILLGLIHIPIAQSPQDSFDVLTDNLLKIVCIFVLMINLIDTRARLRLFFKVVVICGGVLAVFAIRSYVMGEFGLKGPRIWGVVGGMFGNPNDLATSFDLLLPLGVFLALTSRGPARAFYLIVCGLLVTGVVLTFSRSGFLGLLTLAAVMLWKMGRDSRALTVTVFIILLGVFTVAAPQGYSARLLSMFNIESDPTGSAQLRRDQLDRAFDMAVSRPVIGVGLGNYHIYALREQRAHNSYLEISAELGVAGLIAYLILLFAPLRALARIERETTQKTPARAAARSHRAARSTDEAPGNREYRYMSISLQASLAAYLVCSFFASLQYQWYLYYLIAYAIALGKLYEAAALGANPEGAAKERQKVKGVAWRKSRRLAVPQAAGGELPYSD